MSLFDRPSGTTGWINSRDRERAATASAGPKAGRSTAVLQSRISMAAATSPPGPNTGLAMAEWSGSSSPRDTAKRLSRVMASARRSLSGAVVVRLV